MSAILSLLPQQGYNDSILSTMSPTSIQPPFYHTANPHLLSWMPDRYLALAGPIVGYWVLSLVFHLIDTAELPYFEKRRIHESPEVLSRNKATIGQVVRAVAVQQVLQTILGYVWLEDDATIFEREINKDHLAIMSSMTPTIANLTVLALGQRTGEQVLKAYGPDLVRWTYWWGVPILRMLFAFFCIDTWQYWIHRAFHVVPFLYRKVHSVHHRLYVPYAFGALYNHPVEGFFLDSIGTAAAHAIAGLSTREAIFLFTFSSIKTVDDHCGYRLWWDPLQFLFPNNADYHDIHHQAYGIKANFSQPYFTNWDKLLGTEMTRAQAAARTRRVEKLE